VIVGEGSLKRLLREKLEKLELQKEVTLTGALPFTKVIEFYKKASIFVIPSIVLPNGDRDGIPNVLAEAMAMGLVPIATDVSGLPELVIHNRTGMLVPPEDSRAISEACIHLIENESLRLTIGKAARQRVLELFSYQNTSGKLAAIFRTRVIASWQDTAHSR
jgi:glycosyltransferase involved in cell wall biosynthesis